MGTAATTTGQFGCGAASAPSSGWPTGESGWARGRGALGVVVVGALMRGARAAFFATLGAGVAAVELAAPF
jgi:hypothetical protein